MNDWMYTPAHSLPPPSEAAKKRITRLRIRQLNLIRKSQRALLTQRTAVPPPPPHLSFH